MNEFKVNLANVSKNLYEAARSGSPATQDRLLEYYRLGKENPFLASLILHDTLSVKKNVTKLNKFNETLKESALKHVAAVKNIALADQNAAVKGALHEFAEAYRTIYQRTSALRQYLISNERISMDYVTPKASKLFKFKLGLVLKHL